MVLLAGAAVAAAPATAPAGAGQAPAGTADIGFIGLHGGVYEQLQFHSRLQGIRLKYFDDSAIASGEADLGSVSVVYVQHTREEDREAYRRALARARQQNPAVKIVAFDSKGREFLREIAGKDLVVNDVEAGKYYGSTSDNLRRLLTYTAATYLGRQVKIEPPQDAQVSGMYHPDHAGMFEDVGAFLAWRKSGGVAVDGKPRLLIAVHSTHLAFQQPRVVEALVREAEKQGAIAVAIIDGRSDGYMAQAKGFHPDAVIHTCHSTDALPFRTELDVPHLHSIFFRKQSIGEWLQSSIGLSSSEIAFHIVGQELIGAIEPQVVAGTRSGGGGSDAFEPIPERVEHLIRRALSYARLRSTPQAAKKVAIVYYDREMGKGELMRGSSTGMHMNAPRSVVSVLDRMKLAGYTITPTPRNEEELLGWMMDRGRLVGVWAPGELDKLVRTGSPVLIPAEEYEQWYKRRVPEARRAQLDAKWGPAPGKFMVWENVGRKFIVVPRIDLGNVILLPQPLRGEAHGKEALNSQAHDKVTAPPHNYLATYFWLEEKFKANALVHFGTHGSEFALPGKPSGQSDHDWPDVVMGAMLNFNPWIIENMVESAPVRRRAYGTLISHLPPPIVTAGLSDELATLHETIDKWELMEEGGLKEKFAAEIGRLVRVCRLQVDLKLSIPEDNRLDASSIARVNDYLHTILEETTPTSLHVLGEPPRKDLLPAYMVNVLRTPFLKALEILVHGHTHEPATDAPHGTPESGHEHNVRPVAEKILRLMLVDGLSPGDAVSLGVGRRIDSLPEDIDRGLKLALKMNQDFQRTTDEIGNLIAGLDGRFVPPGPGNNPIRNPNAVPTGRNMYLLNPDEVPMRPSWELGKKLADDLIKRHQQQHGQFPTKIGFDLRSSATFRDYGVMEGQILALLGVEPVWDERNLVSDIKLIPREKLGRPRVDVFIAAGGWYESNLPGRLNLWDKAVRLVAASSEQDNPIFRNTVDLKRTLMKGGIDAAKAETLAPARIFGIAPGRETASSLSYSVERSGDWSTREEIARQYLAAHKYVYTEGAWGESAEPLYDAAIQGTHTVVRSWSDYMTSPLSSRYTWLHGGALALGVEQATGKRPDYVISDVRDADKAALVKAEDALQREYRVRLFNRKWVEGMMKEGYAGADHMRFLVSNSFGWEVMRPGSVGDANWQGMKEVLVDDKLQVRLKEWFEKNNPYAYQDATAAMIEAIRKGHWNADEKTRQQLAMEFAQSVGRHGFSGNLRTGGNKPMEEMIVGQLQSIPGAAAKEALAQYAVQVQSQRQIPPADALAAAPAEPTPASPSAPKANAPEATPTVAESVAPPAAAPVEGYRAELAAAPSYRWIWTAAGGVLVLAMIAIGALRRTGTPM
ncbi:cobaltochelatase subunit CobN [Humisphaera borealis]|uniref:Cobaltochelatase subunit CobN n=1 Tax=Humisphaera borealis TaxID=2807512 RepID=A0A7M2X366_9BACT|nr:cobaltochelatase subunit CobN [Humisphaera borealis]QOV92069.1 cobaltochelatase subunit CobN [Humisphaera borealis]